MRIKVLSKERFDDMMFRIRVPSDVGVQEHTDKAFISILNSELPFSYFPQDYSNVLRLVFDDATPEENENRSRPSASNNRSPVLIEGIDDIMVRFAKCCNPLPGDEIVGFISRGRGVIIHRVTCPKALDVDAGRGVDVIWANAVSDRKVLREVRIKIVVLDNQGLMNQMTKTISAKGINIRSINIKVNADKKATGTFDLQVASRQELLACIKDLEGVQGVISVEQI
jgi:GTP pyrophosphokinase